MPAIEPWCLVSFMLIPILSPVPPLAGTLHTLEMAQAKATKDPSGWIMQSQGGLTLQIPLPFF